MNPKQTDTSFEGKDKFLMDIDRMTNEGLAGGYVTEDDNGKIDAATKIHSESEPTHQAEK